MNSQKASLINQSNSEATLCQNCVMSLSKAPLAAAFQCLSCKNMLLCSQCKGKHNPAHRTVVYLSSRDADKLRSEFGDQLPGVDSTNLNCPEHKFDYYTRYCFDCERLICEKCAQNMATEE